MNNTTSQIGTESLPATNPVNWPIIQPFAEAILLELQTTFRDRVTTFSFYYPTDKSIALPAMLLSLESFETGEDNGDDHMPARASWTVHCLLSVDIEQAEIQIRGMVAAVLALIYQNKWDLGPLMDYPVNLGATLQESLSGLAEHLHWTVQWEQTVFLNTATEEAPEFTPETCYAGFEPETGDQYQDQYEGESAEP